MSNVLQELERIIKTRKNAAPESSYVASLHAKGLNKILEKVGEECTETIIAAKDGDKSEVIYETADLWFHSMVMLSELNIGVEDILEELAKRLNTSGHTEKAQRNKG